MEAIAGFEPTGRSTIGPGADLVELGDDNGYRHTAVVFHPELRDHPAIGAALDVVLGFLQEPYVTGLLELVAMDHDEGAFVYPTGQAWSAAEVVRALADNGQVAGVRAGLELMYAAGEVLVEAAEAGEPHGVYSHGGLTPWRVMLKADGQVEILGYALPQVEILQFHADARDIPKEDSFRYCPPERMEERAEELSADLFALALVAFEFMTGKPVYDGLVNDIRTQASRGEGSRRLFRFKDQLPDSVRELFTLCLRARPEDRHASGQDFLDHVRRVLSAPEAEGPALMDVMAQVSRAQRRHGESLDDGKTMGMSREEIQRILGEQELEEERAPQKAQAWSPPAKGRRARKPRRGGEAVAEPAPPPPPPEPDPQPDPAQEIRRSRNAPRRPRRARRGREEAPVQAPAPEQTTRPKPVRASQPVDEPTQPTPQPQGIPSEPSQVQSAGRWGRPGGRRRPRKAPAVSPHESLDAPTEAARDFVDNQAADQLISKLTRSSGDRPVVDDSQEERSASDVIEAILQGSTSGDKPRPPRKRKPKPVSEIQGSPRPRQERSEPPPEAPKPSPHTELALDSAASAPVKPVELVRAVQETTAEIPRTPGQAARNAPPAPSRPERPALQQGSAASFRPPDPMPSTAAGKPESFRLRRGPGGSLVKTRIPTGFSLAEAVSFLTGSVLPLRTDLQGRVRLGYRLGDEEGPHDGTRQISSYQPGSTLVLHPVPAREVWVAVEVHESQEEDAEPTRFRTVVSTALNAATVADALTSWMSLPAGRWFLKCNGDFVPPHLLLDELDLEGVTLVLTR